MEADILVDVTLFIKKNVEVILGVSNFKGCFFFFFLVYRCIRFRTSRFIEYG